MRVTWKLLTTCKNVDYVMGKKDKTKKKSQSTASTDIFKRVEEIYGILTV